MLLLIDNYDSFTYNLFHYINELGEKVDVIRNDQLTVDEALNSKKYKGIVLSPGPCTPNEAGICLDVIKKAKNTMPVFGVCLGHEALGQAFGGEVVRAPEPVHGKTSTIINMNNQGIFKGLPKHFEATRYHSLIIEKETLPECFAITAETEDGIIMGIQHNEYNLHGVQFHPESIASEYGHEMLANFIELTK